MSANRPVPDASGWGSGCVSGDYDNDGDADLYTTYYGSNLLFANQGDGTFAETGNTSQSS